MKAQGTYTIKKWDETNYHQISPERKLTKASVEYSFSGEIEGHASVEYLMHYSLFDSKDQHRSCASFVGLLLFEGKLLGKTGSFVLEDNGIFEAGAVNSSLKIAKDSGTGELKGIHGTGAYSADQNGLRIELEYTI